MNISNKDKNKVVAQAWIDYNPEIVKIDEIKLSNLVIIDKDRFTEEVYTNEHFKYAKPKDVAHYIIALNSINYQFWDIKNNEFVRYQNNELVGSMAMSAGFDSFYEELKSQSFNTALINKELVQKHFGDIPEIEERVLIFLEVFNDRNFEEVWKVLEKDIQRGIVNVDTASKISDLLPASYADPYLKKIQLALYEIASQLKISADITVAADYQVPKVLEGIGVLKYSEELSKKIDNQELIESGSKEELALRAATIIACDEISEKHNISIPALDRILWLQRNEFKKQFHLTKTPHY